MDSTDFRLPKQFCRTWYVRIRKHVWLYSKHTLRVVKPRGTLAFFTELSRACSREYTRTRGNGGESLWSFTVRLCRFPDIHTHRWPERLPASLVNWETIGLLWKECYDTIYLRVSAILLLSTRHRLMDVRRSTDRWRSFARLFYRKDIVIRLPFNCTSCGPRECLIVRKIRSDRYERIIFVPTCNSFPRGII